MTAVTFFLMNRANRKRKKNTKKRKNLARNDQDYDCPQKAGQDNP
ncbi:hypothetical protein AD08_2412 [Escherichia coli 1-110-08_S4_C2]|nr:hypothetical protein AD08_2412 [Escherichia coli 1-110-08_S4_C2]